MNTKRDIFRETLFIIGVFILALTYNLFLLPNNLIIGGTTGLSILLKNYINPTVFIYLSTFILLIVSYVFLGKDISNKTLLGSILYPIFVSISEPLSKILLLYFSFEEYLLTIIIAALFYGVANGIVFRTGYTTGGFDVIAGIITKYLKVPQATALFYANCIVIILGGISFGFNGVLYALIVLYVGSTMTNKIVIGISESKIFFIYTKETDKVKDLITKKLKTGYTVLPTVGGYSHEKSQMIMCVLPTRRYYLLKELVLEADEKAFIVVNDCYDVNGGVLKDNNSLF